MPPRSFMVYLEPAQENSPVEVDRQTAFIKEMVTAIKAVPDNHKFDAFMMIIQPSSNESIPRGEIIIGKN